MEKIKESTALRWPPRVLHVAERLEGGITTYIEELAGGQAADYGKGSVRILCPSQHERNLSDEL